MGISLVFNVQDLVEVKGTLPQNSQGINADLEPIVVPSTSKLEAEKVLESRVKKATRHQVYMEHLIKRRHNLDSEATWVANLDFNKLGIYKDLLSTGVK